MRSALFERASVCSPGYRCLPWQQQIHVIGSKCVCHQTHTSTGEIDAARTKRKRNCFNFGWWKFFRLFCSGAFAFSVCVRETSSVPPSLFAAADNLVGARREFLCALQKKNVNVNEWHTPMSTLNRVRLFAAINANWRKLFARVDVPREFKIVFRGGTGVGEYYLI